jgi:hypothetical protein
MSLVNAPPTGGNSLRMPDDRSRLVDTMDSTLNADFVACATMNACAERRTITHF